MSSIRSPRSPAELTAAGWPIFEPRDFVNFRFLKQDCRRFFETHDDMDFDYVFHLAAIVGGRTVIENNPLAIAADLSIDAAYWQWAQRVHPRKTILFSSSAAYPVRYQGDQGYRLLI